MENVKTEELVHLDIKDIMRRALPVLRRFWFAFLALIVLGATAAALRARYYYTPMYKSEAVFSVSVSSSDSYGLTDYSYYMITPPPSRWRKHSPICSPLT